MHDYDLERINLLQRHIVQQKELYHNMFVSLVAIGCCLSRVVATFDGKSFGGSLEHPVDSTSCVRLFTNDGDIGCRTPSHDGTVGALFEIRNLNDILAISNIDVPFAILTPGKYFDSNLLSTLSDNDKIEGVIVIDEDWVPRTDSSSGPYSTDVKTPQGTGTPQSQYSLNVNYEWNTYGNGAMYESLS
jgi:hypothetical protein